MKPVGIIVNPISGKDLRRLVATASTVTHVEKINAVVRVLRALDALGVRCVRIADDPAGLARRALDQAGERARLDAAPLTLPWLAGSRIDTERAAARMRELDFGCIVVLGGDGTCRSVAAHCGEVPLVALSSGTNNAFPRMVEGTLAGMAAAACAAGALAGSPALHRVPRLELLADGAPAAHALVDIAVIDTLDAGTGVIWEPDSIHELFLAQARPGSIGLSAIGAALQPPAQGMGLHVEMAARTETPALTVIAPMAPGLVERLPLRAWSSFDAGAPIAVRSRQGMFAFDGEREMPVDARVRWSVAFHADGPWVVDVEAALARAASGRFFQTNACGAANPSELR